MSSIPPQFLLRAELHSRQMQKDRVSSRRWDRTPGRGPLVFWGRLRLKSFLAAA